MRKPDEIMAEHLLKGSKMLSKTCPSCGSPLFEYKGTTTCVVCEEEAAESRKERTEPPMSETSENRPGTSKIGTASREEFRGTLDDAFALTIADLLRKARDEPDPGRVIKILKAVRTAAEAYATLSH